MAATPTSAAPTAEKRCTSTTPEPTRADTKSPWDKRKPAFMLSLANVQDVCNDEDLAEERWTKEQLEHLFADGVARSVSSKSH